MAKRPTSRSQADDAAGAAVPSPRRSRRTRGGDTAAAPQSAKPTADAPPQGAAIEPVSARSQDFDAALPEALTSESVSMASEPSEEDIRLRAYHRYLERGGSHGTDFEDWLEAERDLKNR